MKKYIILVLFLATQIGLFSQTPDFINYQAIARNASGDIFFNHNVSVQIRILQGPDLASTVYTENFYTQSNEFGLIQFSIGTGVVQYGSFNSIDWSQAGYSIWMGLDVTGGNNFRPMGADQFVSVPYAFYAESSGTSFQYFGLLSYSQSEIDSLIANPGTVVYNVTTSCVNFFNGVAWTSLCGDQMCTPMPSTANAGANQSIYGVITNLTGSYPDFGNNEIGVWRIISGVGGVINEPGKPNSVFSGITGETYQLMWTISTICGSSSDVVFIEFLACDDGNPCTNDYLINGVCQNEIIAVTVANAGPNQPGALNPVSLEADPALIGFGYWSIFSGTGGSISDSLDYQSTFAGISGTTYKLVWHVEHLCGASSDTVVITVEYPFACGDSLIDIRDNQTYTTIEINGHCWMTENLNYGGFVSSTQGQSNNSIPEKYCYGNIQAKCLTQGGLYTWNELMRYNTYEYAQGLCPNGWHVPTDLEWYGLENFVDPSVSNPTAIGIRGTDVGTKLLVGGNSGVDIIYSGTYYPPDNKFYGSGTFNKFGNYASSSVEGGFSWMRIFSESQSGIERSADSKSLGYAARCIKNYSSQPCVPMPSRANAGPDRQIGSTGTVTLSATDPALGSGKWKIAYGTGGSFSNDTLPNSAFNGTPGKNYRLVWTVSTACSSTCDTMFVYAANPPFENIIKARWNSAFYDNNGNKEITDLEAVPRPVQGGRAYSFASGAKVNTGLNFGGMDYFQWEFDIKKSAGNIASLAQVGSGNSKIQFCWWYDGSLYVQIGTLYGGTNSTLYDSLIHIKVVYDGVMPNNAAKLKIYINDELQTLSFSGSIPNFTPAIASNFIFGAGPNVSPVFKFANFKNIHRYGALLNFYKCDEQTGTVSFDCTGGSAGTITNAPAGFHCHDNDFTPWADRYGYSEDNLLTGRIIPLSVNSNGDHTSLDINGQVPSYLGKIGANLEIVGNPCIKGNGVNAFVQFNYAGVANIASVEVHYFNGTTWVTVADIASAGTSVPGLWRITGPNFFLLADGANYFNNKVSELICRSSSGDEIIHANFSETRSTKAFNRARHTRDGDGVYMNFTPNQFVYDDRAYPVAMVEGYDLWEYDFDLGTYIVVAYHTDGTPLLTDGDSWTDYSWVSSQAPASGTEFHNGAPSKLQLANNPDVLDADLDGVFSTSTATLKKLSFADIKQASLNPLYFQYGNRKLKEMVLYNQEITGVESTEANTFFRVKEKDNFVFHGDSHTAGLFQKAGWNFPSQYFRMYENRYQMTNLAVSGWTSAQLLADIGNVAALYDSTKDDNYAIILIGANDIMNTIASPNQLYVNLQEIWATCRASGFFVVAVTLLPHTAQQANMDAINTLIKSDPSLYDLLLDLTLDPDIGVSGADLGPFYNGDHIHLKEQGARKIAEMLHALLPE